MSATPMLLALPVLLAAAPQDPPLDAEGLVAEARALVERLAAEDAFSGSVLVARGDEVLFEVAVGEASKRFHAPNRVDTRFNLGSMNKMFTAVCIARLVEEGVLAWDEPIARYVDESWLPRAITEQVTVLHLITHTSGLGSFFNEEYVHSSRELFRELDDYKPLIRGETLAFEPGTRWAYSNTGLFLLGVVIERATGESYFEHVREHVYGPAGMTASDCYPMDEPVENLAIGYHPDSDCAQGWRNNLYRHVLRGGPAGGGFSTVGDLFRFGQALLEGRLLSVGSLDLLWTDHLGAGYGRGFSVRETPRGRVVGHGGGFEGISANLDLFVDQGWTVAVMSNYSGAATPLAQALRALVLRVED